VSNAFYDAGEQRAAKVNDLFATIARRYDLINDLQSFGLHRLWKRRVVELAKVQPGNRALDLCCGTGDIALALAQRGAETAGLDFSEKMLDVAKTRSQKPEVRSQNEKLQSAIPAASKRSEGGRNPQFIRGDAQQIPFPDNSFDIVTVGYGLRNLTSWERGLDEMFRVAKPGGRIVVLEFCGNASAYAYILESLKHYPAQLAVAEKMHGLKLANVRVINLLGGAMAINYGEKPK
jgi:demethylmenaquinone methyltransferase/2-methoxy-6-polyprenyl-1,4-benzoquinol methylase